MGLKMKVYNELITVNDLVNVGSIFTELKKLNVNLVMDSDRMTSLFLLRYGDRNVNPSILPLTPYQIADLLTFEFSQKWEILLTEFWVGFNLGAKQVTKVTETITRTENRLTDKDDINTVSGFDSDELITDNGLNSKTKDDLTGTETKTTTNEIIDMETAFNNLSLTTQNSIIETVLNDVKNFITLSIY